MAVTITSAPTSEVRPAGQYLVYTLDEATTPERYIVQVYRSTSTASIGSEKARLYITPNASGKCHFDLSKIAEGILEYPLSRNGVPIHSVQDASNPIFWCDELHALKFTIRAGQYNSPTASLNQDSDEIYLIRGTEQISSGLLPSFSDYYPGGSSKKVWLTDREQNPSDNHIYTTMSEEDEGVVMFLQSVNLGLSGSTVVDVRYDAYENGNFIATYTKTLTGSSTEVRQNHLAVPIGPAHWSFLGIASNADRVRVAVINPGGIMSCWFYVDLDCRPLKHDATQLAWVNTRGGWDYLRFDSRAPKTVSVQGKTYRKSVGTFGESTFSIASNIQQYDTYGKTGKEKYTLSEQFFTADDRELLQYLMRSNVVQMRVGTGEWEPCQVVTNSLKIEPRGSKLYAVTLDVELARDIRC